MKAAFYYVKHREYLGKVPRAFGGNVASWGKWLQAASSESLETARQLMANAPRSGLREYAIWHRGKRLT